MGAVFVRLNILEQIILLQSPIKEDVFDGDVGGREVAEKLLFVFKFVHFAMVVENIVVQNV